MPASHQAHSPVSSPASTKPKKNPKTSRQPKISLEKSKLINYCTHIGTTLDVSPYLKKERQESLPSSPCKPITNRKAMSNPMICRSFLDALIAQRFLETQKERVRSQAKKISLRLFSCIDRITTRQCKETGLVVCIWLRGSLTCLRRSSQPALLAVGDHPAPNAIARLLSRLCNPRRKKSPDPSPPPQTKSSAENLYTEPTIGSSTTLPQLPISPTPSPKQAPPSNASPTQITSNADPIRYPPIQTKTQQSIKTSQQNCPAYRPDPQTQHLR
jgi:hypothetical protein